MDGYTHLALAVVQQAVYDVRHGTPERRRKTRLAIRQGGLDRWLDLMCLKRGSYRYFKAHLRKLAAQA